MCTKQIPIWLTPSTLTSMKKEIIIRRALGVNWLREIPNSSKILQRARNWESQPREELILPEDKCGGSGKIWSFVFMGNSNGKIMMDDFRSMPERMKSL